MKGRQSNTQYHLQILTTNTSNRVLFSRMKNYENHCHFFTAPRITLVTRLKITYFNSLHLTFSKNPIYFFLLIDRLEDVLAQRRRLK